MYRNNGYNDRGGYYRDRGYNDRGGYNRGGYNDRGGYDRQMDQQQDQPFEINQPVRHVGTGAKLIVIKYGREQVECRTPDLRSEYFYLYELEPWPDNQ